MNAGYFKKNDRVTCDLAVGFQDDDGMFHGSEWITKTGTVNELVNGGDKIYIKFDDGDMQITRNARGRQKGHPARNVQPVK